MNEKLIELINEKGPEIAKQLSIATEQVYDKVLWYIRLNGIAKLTTIIFILLLLIPWYKITKKIKTNGDDEAWLFSGLCFLGASPLIWLLFYNMINLLLQIISPEYYIVNQILTEISGGR